MKPEWTLVYNIVSPESDEWVGTGWEFFTKWDDAYNAMLRHTKLGNVPTLRPYHDLDERHLGAAHHAKT